jgi:hypothetical protein
MNKNCLNHKYYVKKVYHQGKITTRYKKCSNCGHKLVTIELPRSDYFNISSIIKQLDTIRNDLNKIKGGEKN